LPASASAVSNLPASSRPSRGLLVAIFIVTLSMLAFEIALTRAFSVLLHYHFVFLAVSLATCGLGVGGLIDFIIRHKAAATQPAGVLIVAAAGLAILAPSSVLVLFSTPLSAHLTSVWVLTAVCLPVFVFAGIFLSHAFAQYTRWSGHLYFADLSGAALGSLLVIVFLQLAGGINTPIICGVLAAAAALIVAYLSRRTLAVVATGVLMVLLIAALVGNLSRRWIDLPHLPRAAYPAAKSLYRELGDPSAKARIIYSEWNAFARTDVVAYARPDGQFHKGGDLLIYTDGEVPTNMIHFAGDLSGIQQRCADFIGFLPFRTQRPNKVLLIGPGGGLDVLMALAVGAQQIDGVELNPSMLKIVRKFREFAGPVYDYENVNVCVGEGRSFVSRSAEKYDLIYMALTKTGVTASSSLAVTESYAHTREGFRAYFRHLSPSGRLAFVCEHPAILLRALLSAREVIKQVEDVSGQQAMNYLAVASVPQVNRNAGPYRHLLIMSRQPFTAAQSQHLGEQVVGLGLVPAFFPGAYESVPFRWLSHHELTSREFVAKYNTWKGYPAGQRINFMPCTDDRPFVWDISFGIPAQFRRFVWLVLISALILSALAWGWLSSKSPRVISGRQFVLAVLYFSLLGAGFMLLEVVLIQRLILYLGYPVLTLSVILFSLLVGGGIGSLVSQRWTNRAIAARAAWAAAGAATLTLAVHLLLPLLTSATMSLDIRLRSLGAMAILLPIGFCLGIPFPSGLRLVGTANADIVPWLWGINGLTSVVGSVAAMILAKLVGFSTVMLVGIGIYVVVSCLLATGLMGYPGSHLPKPAAGD